MIDESALNFKRGELVEFQLRLGGGPKRCRGLVLNTAVLFGRAARQLWILDMDDPTPQLEAAWTRRKHVVHEEDIVALIPSTVIGGTRCCGTIRFATRCRTEERPWRYQRLP